MTPITSWREDTVVAAAALLGLERRQHLLGPTWHGVVDGRAVELRPDEAGEGNWGVAIVAWRSAPTDLGLLAYQSSPLLFADPTIATGDAAFDAIFSTRLGEVAGDAREAIVQAQLSPAVRSLLLVQAGPGTPTLTDMAAVNRFSTYTLEPQILADRVRSSVALAKAADEAARALDYPAPLAASGVGRAFESAARSLGLEVTRNQLGATGAVAHEVLTVRVRTSRKAVVWPGRFDAENPQGVQFLSVFDEPLALEFSVSPAHVEDRLLDLLGKGDVKTGDAAFDRAFRVSTDQPDALRAALTEEARARLMRLHALGLSPSLDAVGLTLRGSVPKDAEVLPRALNVAVGISDAMRGGSGVPFR